MINTLGKIYIILILSIYLNAQESFTLKLSKKSVYVTEAIKATLVLKYTAADPYIRTDFEEFIAKSFWIRELNETDPIKKGEYFYKEYTYLLFPQTSGDISIDKQLINVAKREDKTYLIKWSKLYSQKVYIKVLPLPKNTNIQGDYKIQTSLDNKTFKANKPINLTLNIKGSGNIDDIEQFKLNLKEQLIFTDKAIIKSDFKDNIYGGEYIQKFSIVSNSSFVIPAISFKYFNTKTKMIEVLKTKPINIEIKIKKIKPTKDDKIIKYIFGVLGFVFGILFIYIIRYVKSIKKREVLPVEIKIKKSKNDKELYMNLLPYINKYHLDSIMTKLDENIYHNGKNKISKKEIIKKMILNK